MGVAIITVPFEGPARRNLRAGSTADDAAHNRAEWRCLVRRHLFCGWTDSRPKHAAREHALMFQLADSFTRHTFVTYSYRDGVAPPCDTLYAGIARHVRRTSTRRSRSSQTTAGTEL